MTERSIISLRYEKNSFYTLAPQSKLQIGINLLTHLGQGSAALSLLRGPPTPSQRAHPTRRNESRARCAKYCATLDRARTIDLGGKYVLALGCVSQLEWVEQEGMRGKFYQQVPHPRNGSPRGGSVGHLGDMFGW